MNIGVGPGGLFRSSRRFVLAGSILSVVTVIAAGLTIWDLREDAIANGREDISNLGVVIAEQTARSLQAVDLVVQEARDKAVAAGVETTEQFNRLMATEGIHHFLADRLKNLPQADGIALVGADGSHVNSSRSWPIPDTNMADRDYYQHFREHDDPGVFISAPLRSRTTGTWTIFLARRVNGPHGEFLGVALGMVALRYFEDFFRAISLQNEGSVAVLRRDGVILARFPSIEDRIGKPMPPESQWYGRVAAGGGTYQSVGKLSGLARLISIHPMRDYPLVIDIAVSEEAVLHHWRRQSTYLAICALCAVIGFVVLFSALAAQFRRLKQSEASLAARNLDLEDNRARLEKQTSEIIQTAEALHASQRMLRGIIDQFPAKIAAKDRDLRFLVVNSTCARELGCPPEAAVGRKRAEFPIAGVATTTMTEWSSDVMKRDLEVLETGQPVMNIEDKLTYADGRVEYFLTSKAPLLDAGNAVAGVITVAVDITAQKRAETERRGLEQQLQHAQKIEALGQLAGGIAHDLNNALVPVLAMTELVLHDLPAASRDRGALEMVLAGAKRSRELVGQILAFSRREQAARHEFDLTEIAGEALKMLRASIPSTIMLIDKIDPALPMIGDPGQLHQVLVNLAVNAAQAIGDQQGMVTVRAQRESDGAHVRLSVADTGCGMDEVTRERIFEPFFTTKEVGKGTGLGLSIVHGIVTNHGGTIAVESAPGQGTRFDIILPTGLADAASADTFDAEPTAAEPTAIDTHDHRAVA